MLHFSSHQTVTFEKTLRRAAENPHYPVQRSLNAFMWSFNKLLPDAILAPKKLDYTTGAPTSRPSCRL